MSRNEPLFLYSRTPRRGASLALLVLLALPAALPTAQATGTPTSLSPGTQSGSPVAGPTLATSSPTLAWSAPAGGAEKYGVYVAQAPYSGGLVVSNEAVTGTSFQVSLSCDTTYRWNMRAYTSAGGWGPFAPNPDRMYFTTPTCATTPGKPTSLSPGTQSGSQVAGPTLSTSSPTLSWTAPAGSVDRYGVYVAQAPYTGPLVVDDQWVTGTSRQVSLSCGMTYRWNVQAHNSAGWGELAPNPDRMYFTTAACPPQRPGAPTNLAPGTQAPATSTSTKGPTLEGLSTTLTWSAPAGPVDSYGVYLNAYPYPETPAHQDESVASTNWATPTLACGTTYRWNVRAHNNVGWGDLAPNPDRMYFTTAPCAGNAPNAPAAVSGPATRATGQAGTYATSAIDPDGDSVRYVFDWGDGSASCTTPLVASGTSATCSHAWSTTGAHCVKARAQDSPGGLAGAASPCLQVTVGVPSVPSVPKNVTAWAGNGNVTLTWKPPTSNGGSAVTGYRVYRDTVSGGAKVLLTSGGCGNLGAVLKCTDKGLTNGKRYYYHVVAVNGAGASSPSGERNSIPSQVMMVTPANLKVLREGSYVLEDEAKGYWALEHTCAGTCGEDLMAGPFSNAKVVRLAGNLVRVCDWQASSDPVLADCRQCVELPRGLSGYTARMDTLVKGPQVTKTSALKEGTVIAVFDGTGKYASKDQHIAIFKEFARDSSGKVVGIIVWDQNWTTSFSHVLRHTILFSGTGKVNDAATYSVVHLPGP